MRIIPARDHAAPGTFEASGPYQALIALGRRLGRPMAGAALVIVSAFADSADSGVAVLCGASTGRGSFYDSVADRCSEIAWLVALWLLGAPGLLVVACGATHAEAVPGAVTFPAVGAIDELRTLVDDAARGVVDSVAFALPSGAGWPLPIYELALMTSAEVEARNARSRRR